MAAYNPESKDYVVVALNTNADDQIWEFGFDGLEGEISTITAVRTSGDMDSGENWCDVTGTDRITMSEDSFSALVKGYLNQ